MYEIMISKLCIHTSNKLFVGDLLWFYQPIDFLVKLLIYLSNI
jgi:hypothetical protein